MFYDHYWSFVPKSNSYKVTTITIVVLQKISDQRVVTRFQSTPSPKEEINYTGVTYT